MTMEYTEGMPQKAGVLQGDDLLSEWRQGQYGRFGFDNRCINPEFAEMLDKNPENMYFNGPKDSPGANYGKNRYKWKNSPSSDPSRWPDSKMIVEYIPKDFTQQTRLTGSVPVRAPTMTGPTMSKGITKEVKCMLMTEGEGDSIEAINTMLADQEWALFSTTPLGESRIVFTFIR